MAKKTKPTKRITQIEALSLFEFAIAEAYAQGIDKHYRISFDYGPSKADAAKIVVEFYVYFDGELHDASKADDSKGKFKIDGPKKIRH